MIDKLAYIFDSLIFIGFVCMIGAAVIIAMLLSIIVIAHLLVII